MEKGIFFNLVIFMAVQDSLLPLFHHNIKQSFISSFFLYEITQLLLSKEEPHTICY